MADNITISAADPVAPVIAAFENADVYHPRSLFQTMVAGLPVDVSAANPVPTSIAFGPGDLARDNTTPALAACSLLVQRGGSSNDMNVDGSVTPVVFEYEVPGSRRLYLSHVSLSVMDSTITPNQFGALAALPNGVQLQIQNAADAAVLDLLGGAAASDMFDLSTAGAASVAVLGGGDESATFGFDMTKLFGAPVVMEAGESVALTVRDNLASLNAFRGTVWGVLETVS